MKDEDFEIIKEKTPEGIRFTIKGRIDSINASALEHKLEEAIKDKEHNIILDMLYVEYLCSTGIRVILKTFKEAKEAGGKLGIESASERVRNVLGMVALDEMLIK